MMPKSTTASAPSLSTNMLPGCRSAWKKPSRNTCLKNAPVALGSSSSTSCPAATSAARSSTRMPPMRSVVSTARPVRCQSIRGTRKLGSPAKFSANSEAAAASKRRSISSWTDCARVSTTSTGFSRRRVGWVRSVSRASHKNRSRSRATARAIPGRNTLTATSCPSVVTAKWTCAIEAAATGVSSNEAKRLATGRPNSPSIRARASAPEKGGKRSCSSARSSVISSPSRSARVDRIWPSLMKLGPISVKAAASRSPGRATARSRRRTSRVTRRNGAMPATRSNGNSASWRASTRAIRTRRARLRPLRRSPNTSIVRSEPPGRMQRGDPARQITEPGAAEPRGLDQSRQRALRRKAADALDEIGIGLAIASDDLTEQRQYPKAVEVVERLQEKRHRRGEFEAEEPPARSQHAAGLGEGALDPGHVAQAEGDRVEVERAVGEGQLLGVAAQPLDAAENAVVECAGAAGFDHLPVGVADDDPAAGIGGEARQRAARDVAGAAGDVEQALAGARVEPGH